MSLTTRRRRGVRARAFIFMGITAGSSVGVASIYGCLDRPLAYVCPGSIRTVTQQVHASAVDKVDLLLVIDNSSSMADKQHQLEERVPDLVAALTNPPPGQRGVKDVHLAVVTSSLGAQGSWLCQPGITPAGGAPNPVDMNDSGHLMPRAAVGAGGSGYTSSTNDTPPQAACQAIAQNSALTWTFDGTGNPAPAYNGSDGATQLQAQVSCLVGSVNENGCGFEETWESMYHFLVDPAPYQTADAECTYHPDGSDPTCNAGGIQVRGVDQAILSERAAFLRPDSLLGVVLMSDENDFSLEPVGENWRAWGWVTDPNYSAPKILPRGTPGCAKIADDIEPGDAAVLAEADCRPCYNAAANDPDCKTVWPSPADNTDSDAINLRGFQQVQRFGANFLWPRQRYVDAFTLPQVPGSDGKVAQNPIFAGSRTKDLVIVAGIVGVPKRLLEDADGVPLAQLSKDDWDKMISPDLSVRDPHMIESIAPRAGLPKYSGTVAFDANGNANSDNGGERDIADGVDLQYACIASRNGAPPDAKTDCLDGNVPITNNPLCGVDSNGKSTQPNFKGYPGLRHLRILHDLGDSGFAASICNKTYAPAIAGLVAKIQGALKGECSHSTIIAKSDGSVPCEVIQVLADGVYDPAKDGGGACEKMGSAFCTPGAAGCNDPSSPFAIGNVTGISATVLAAAKITISMTSVSSGGTATTNPVSATVDGAGNVVVQAVDDNGAAVGGPRLVCETVQLAGSVPAIASYAELSGPTASKNSCVTDVGYAGPTVANGGKLDGGWCYATDPTIVGPQCVASGAVGTVRFLGTAQPSNGTDIFTVCVSGTAADEDPKTCNLQDAGSTDAAASGAQTTSPTSGADATAE